MTHRTTRLARGWVVGVLATAAAALSHAVAGGGTPSPLALSIGVVFGGMLGTFALSARPSLPRLAIAVGVSQLAFHLAFSTLGAATAAASTHAHELTPVVMTSAGVHSHPATPLMWVAHAVAGVVTLALLRGAERAAWWMLAGVARLVRSSFRAPASMPLDVPRVRALLATRAPARLASCLLDRAVSRRGPPVSVAF